MGRRGPAPQPTKLRILRGNPGKRKINKNEPKPTNGEPPMPSWLPAEGKTAWRWIVRELAPIGVVTLADEAALTATCEAWARYVKASKRYHRSGCPRSEKIARFALTQVRQFLGEFGLTPSARTRLSGHGHIEEKDPLAELMPKRIG